MNAASAARFHDAAQASDEALHPGSVRISGQDYTAGVVLGEIQSVPRADGGGTLRRQLVTATIRKALLTSPPAKDALMTVNGIDFKIDFVDGSMPADTAWLITAARFPQ